jgi:hypothetical protein
VQQDEYSIEMSTAASAAFLADRIAAIFAGVGDWSDTRTGAATYRQALRDAERAEWNDEFKGEF